MLLCHPHHTKTDLSTFYKKKVFLFQNFTTLAQSVELVWTKMCLIFAIQFCDANYTSKNTLGYLSMQQVLCAHISVARHNISSWFCSACVTSKNRFFLGSNRFCVLSSLSLSVFESMRLSLNASWTVFGIVYYTALTISALCSVHTVHYVFLKEIFFFLSARTH